MSGLDSNIGLARLDHPAEALACWKEAQSSIHAGQALGHLAAHLPRELLSDALALAERLDDYDRSHALLGLLTRAAELGDGLAALVRARDVPEQEHRAKLLRALMPHLQEEPPTVLFQPWVELLAGSAARSRTDLLSDLRCSAPLLHVLAAQDDVLRLVEGVLEVGRWFP